MQDMEEYIAYVIDNHLFEPKFQPVADLNHSRTFGYICLMNAAHIPNPEILYKYARKSNRLFDLETASIILALHSVAYNIEQLSPDTHLFLNVHSSTLESPAFTILSREIASTSFLPPERIVLNINTYNIQDSFKLKKAIVNFKKLGFQIAIQIDRNTTLKKVIELHPQFIHLAAHFSNGLTESVSKQAALHTIMEHCVDNRIPVVLHGVKTEKDLTAAKSFKVSFAQTNFKRQTECMTI